MHTSPRRPEGALPRRRNSPAAQQLTPPASRAVLDADSVGPAETGAAVGGGLRLLFLLPFAPCLEGDHGAARVTAQLIAALSVNNRVAVLALRHATERSPDGDLLDRLDLYEELPRRGPRRLPERARRAVSWRLALAMGTPFWVSELKSAAYRKRLADLLDRFRPDVVQVEFSAMGQYLPVLDGTRVPRVLVEHDVPDEI